MSITVVLRKMGKKNYRIPKAYRPIALLNTIGISTEHAVLHLVDWIQRAWGNGYHVVTMVLVDVSGAYDNVSHQ
jgi:hypothetical protein